MIAVDTNVVLRLIVGDDVDQLGAALRLIEQEPAFVSLTVLVETEWVMRSRYGYSRLETAAALGAFIQLEGVVVDRPSQVQWALTRHAIGADFADMIHLISASDARAFTTFDRNLAKSAGKGPPMAIRRLA